MTALIRDPAEWATDNGWISRRRAVNIAAKIEDIARVIEESLGESGSEEGDQEWSRALRQISRTIAPAQTPCEKRLSR